MSGRLAALVLGVMSLSANAAGAQERLTFITPDLAPVPLSFALSPSPIAAPEPAQIERTLPPSSAFRAPGRSPLMTSLYASTAVMQALDVHSTLTAFRAGAVEGNPLMKDISGSPAAFVGVKVGVAAATILAARQLAKHNKMAAIITLVGINSAYAMVVSHNYRLARSLP